MRLLTQGDETIQVQVVSTSPASDTSLVKLPDGSHTRVPNADLSDPQPEPQEDALSELQTPQGGDEVVADEVASDQEPIASEDEAAQAEGAAAQEASTEPADEDSSENPSQSDES